MLCRADLRSPACALLCVLAVACGDDGDERPRYRSNQAPDTPVSTLNDEQLAEVCGTFTTYVDTYVDLDAIAYTACLPIALITASPQQCEEALSSCMSTFPPPISIRTMATIDACIDDLRACDVTVGDFENCVNARVDVAVGAYSCSGAGDSGYLQNVNGLTQVCVDLDNHLCDQYEQQAGPE